MALGDYAVSDSLMYNNALSNPYGFDTYPYGNYNLNNYGNLFEHYYNMKNNGYNDYSKPFSVLNRQYYNNFDYRTQQLFGNYTNQGNLNQFKINQDLKIPENLTPQQRQEYIQQSDGGIKQPEQKEQNGGNTALKVAGITVAVAGVAIACDYIFAKGKHVNKLTKFFRKTEGASAKTKLPKTSAQKKSGHSETPAKISEQTKELPRTSTNPLNIKFSNINEAQNYFRDLGINADLSKCSDLSHAEHVANSLRQIQQAGVTSQIKSITYTPFDEHSLTEALAKRGLTRDALPAGDISWAYGASEQGHVFLNPRGVKYMANGSNVSIHEVGHYHRNILQDSFRTKWNAENPDALIDHEKIISSVANRSGQSVENVMQKLETALHREVKAYSSAADENFADQFALMVEDKKIFSEGAMLYYDMFGGARLPNKIINGLKYDDYMVNLYSDAENILLNYIK